MSEDIRRILADRFASDKEIVDAVQRAVREALILHKRLGNPVAAWQDGKVIIIPAEEIVIPPAPGMEAADFTSPSALKGNPRPRSGAAQRPPRKATP